LVYLAGSVIDYKDGLTGAGFRITNPNAKQNLRRAGNPLRPDRRGTRRFERPSRRAIQSARQNFPAMAVLLAAMAAFVVIYYWVAGRRRHPFLLRALAGIGRRPPRGPRGRICGRHPFRV